MGNVSLPTTLTVNADATKKTVKGGAAIVIGEWVYQDTTTKKHLKAQGDTAAHADVQGVAVTASGDGQELVIVTDGDIEVASGLVKGMWYVLSDSSAGDMMLASDLGNGDYSTLLGYAKSTTIFHVKIVKSGLAYTS